ncbi:hypothetical protein MMC30_005930 [Trapelia coarctata]|nr:hypothetical protein [Trapelia coarctata]
MAPINIPRDGLELSGTIFTDHTSSKSQPHTVQALHLSFPEQILADIVNSARKGTEKLVYSVSKPGKPNTITIDNITYPFEIQKKMAAFGFLGLKPLAKLEIKRVTPFTQYLETKKANTVDALDPDVQALQRSLADIQQKKQSNTTIFIKDKSKLPPAKGGKQAAPKAIGSLSFLKGHRAGLFDHRNVAMAATTRSMPASPSLGAILPNTNRPDEKALKAEALKVALIHLLAVRPVSQKFICTTLKCSTADVALVLEKYGRQSRLDPDKFDLSDRGYKELDVWKFNYKNQEDRQAAIDRAVKAYDRQRISREEKLWQLLLPKEERGKGTILSNLSLHEGPITKVSTPLINVQGTDETKAGGDTTGTDSDNRNGRLAPGNAETIARSRSQDPIKKKRVSEKEAQTRRLLSKNPKKVQAPKAKESKPAKPVAKEPKKTAALEATKVKSAEFVRDSDEDIEMADAPITEAPAPAPTPAPKRTGATKVAPVAKPAEKRLPPIQKQAAPKVKEAEAKQVPSKALSPQSTPNLSKSSSSGSVHRLSDASQTSTSMMRTLSHKRTTSSPMKPSPLGSSPPANASDFDNDKGAVNSSSSSTTPMINMRKTNGEVRTVKPSQASAAVNSDRGLKRKANDIDSDIHHHGGVSVTNGKIHPAKRQQTVANTPPTSDSSNETSPRVSNGVLHQAQRFKKLYHEYEKLHRQLSGMAEPPQDRVKPLIKMHARLEELKGEISQAVGS